MRNVHEKPQLNVSYQKKMKARLSHVSVMSSTNMLKQIKARREVSMFASQPQANGTNDQII